MSCGTGSCGVIETFAQKSCKALQPQNCIYTVQGELVCNNDKDLQNYDRKNDLSFGVPFYEGNFAQQYEFFSQTPNKQQFIRGGSTMPVETFTPCKPPKNLIHGVCK